MKLVLYARISSRKQSENSIEAQLYACRKWAEDNHHTVVREYVDLAQSAKTADRTEFQKVLKAVLGGQADAILVHKLDRFSRSREDSVMLKAMLRRKGKQVISVSEPLGDSPADRLLEGVLETLNDFYLLNLATETQKGLRNLARKGIYPRRPPLGYYRKDRLSYVDEVVGPLMAEAFTDFSTGRYTLNAWVAEAFERGLRTKAGGKIYAGRWSKLFHNLFYVGEIKWGDEIFKGIHTPLADRDTFDKVQAILAGRRNTKVLGARHRYMYTKYLWSSVYKVGMSGNTVKNNFKKKFFYYRAIGDGPEHNVSEAVIKEEVVASLKKVRVSNGDLAAVGGVLRLAIKIASDVGSVLAHLESDELKVELLDAVLPRNSLSVDKAGNITVLAVNLGFSIAKE